MAIRRASVTGTWNNVSSVLVPSLIVDVCASIRARGRRVRFVADVTIRHQRGASAAPAARETAYRRSYLAFYEKHHPAWVPWLRAYLWLFGRR